jgi:fused signal recognition particle receptor
MSDTPAEEKKPGFFARLRQGLSRSASSFAKVVTRKKLDQETLDQLEEALIGVDVSPDIAKFVLEEISRNRFDREISDPELKAALAKELATILERVRRPFRFEREEHPHVVLVIGVNGSGKTTTIGKLAQKLVADGKSVMLAAGDTFRAAAIEQLQIWGSRVGVPVIAKTAGADSAGLAFEALEKARAQKSDFLLIDTAGRLQNKANLMSELQKVQRVLKKIDPTAPHSVLLILDATTGQNALSQVEVFREMAGVTGLIMTKLDGTARGGILVSLAEKFGMPIHWIGVGESVDDLQAFDAEAFAKALVGAE